MDAGAMMTLGNMRENGVRSLTNLAIHKFARPITPSIGT
jgi:hypothetical protein